MLDQGILRWKSKARKSIREAQLVLYVAGNEFDEKNIRWELKTAIKYRKPICVIKKNEDVRLSDGLMIKDDFSGAKTDYGYQVISYSQLLEIAQGHRSSTYGLFNERMNFQVADSDDVYLEQYKLFVQTSEELVKRRQNVNSFYMSIHSALLAFMGAMFALEIDLTFLQCFGIVLCVAGITMSYSWWNMLVSYGQLNSAKMKIIGMLEAHLPLSLYDAEWRVLDDPMSKKRYKSFTQKESAIPWCFMCLYIILFVILLYAILSGTVSGTEIEASAKMIIP